MRDLRGFLAKVRSERPSEFIEVRREVCAQYETAAILARFEQRYKSPLLFFPRVKGCQLPVVTNVCGSKGRIALAMECGLNEVGERYARACEARVKPNVKSAGPVQDVVFTGSAVDLAMLPQMIYHENDCSNPYITAAIVVAQDPETSAVNLSYHRLMIAGRNRTGIFMERRHLFAIYCKYMRSGEAMPIAAFIGSHPLWSMGAACCSAPGIEEYDVIGGLQGEPLDVVKCVAQPGICVPCHAELVLEGRVLPMERIREGPFGEFTGVSKWPAETPVFEIEAVTHRKEPLFQDIVSGRIEHLLLGAIPQEVRLLELARSVSPGVTSLGMPVPLTVFVGMNKTSDEEPRQVIEAVVSHLYAKHVVVVDSMVDTNDIRQVATAIALNVQCDRDVYIFPGQHGSACDPSCDDAGARTAKMGIDATGRLSQMRSVTRNSIPKHILESIDMNELHGTAV